MKETNNIVLKLNQSMKERIADTLYDFVSREIDSYLTKLCVNDIVMESQLHEDLELEKFIILSEVQEMMLGKSTGSAKEDIVKNLNIAKQVTRLNMKKFVLNNLSDLVMVERMRAAMKDRSVAILVID